MGYLGLLLIVWGCIVWVQRALWRRGKRLGKGKVGFYPSGASIGNALQVLQAIAEPQVQHVIEERLEEPAEDDGEAGPKDPTAHLMRQARRIRNGDDVRLTAWAGAKYGDSSYPSQQAGREPHSLGSD
jgi:hypothetical protein